MKYVLSILVLVFLGAAIAQSQHEVTVVVLDIIDVTVDPGTTLTIQAGNLAPTSTLTDGLDYSVNHPVDVQVAIDGLDPLPSAASYDLRVMAEDCDHGAEAAMVTLSHTAQYLVTGLAAGNTGSCDLTYSIHLPGPIPATDTGTAYTIIYTHTAP